MRIAVRWLWRAIPLWAVLSASILLGQASWWGMASVFLLGATLGAAVAGGLCHIGLERALERAQAATSEAERANVAKSKFLAAASHDIRQPVQSLALFMAILEQRAVDTPLSPVTAQMGRAVAALSSLLTSLLDISRLDAGIIVPELANQSVHDLVGRLAHEYDIQARAKGLRFVAKIEPALALTDPNLLERVVRNLLENAVRYTERGGVLVRLRRCHGRIRLDVVDTGIGIDPEHYGPIFDEFFQISNAARDHSQGLGLGLSIVARLSKLIGGEISATSRIGRGSRFTVMLPAAETPLTRSGIWSSGSVCLR